MPQITACPIHLGPGGRAIVQPVFDGPSWFDAYADRNQADGAAGWLVTQYAFEDSWSLWEAHHDGSEVVLCLAGRLTLIQEREGDEPTRIPLEAGDYAVNPPGVWHTADIADGESAICLFLTPGLDTAHRAR